DLVLRRVDSGTQDTHDLAVHRYTASADKLFTLAPRGEPSVCQHLLQPFCAHAIPLIVCLWRSTSVMAVMTSSGDCGQVLARMRCYRQPRTKIPANFA